MTTASTVIVGGGVVGCAAAFFLVERGERGVVLLERDRLGQGTSKGGLGGIRHQFVDELDVRLSKLAVAFWKTFEERTGAKHDFRQRGYLFIAETPEGLAQLREPLPLYDLDRTTAFSDGVIAIAITLLVLSIDVPDLADNQHEKLGQALWGLREQFAIYALSFWVIARYWLMHHRLFGELRSLNGRLITLNLAFLALIALVPILGGVTWFVVSVVGLGILAVAARRTSTPAVSQPAPPLPPAPVTQA